ncbi:MAG: hypothetical protein KF699_09450 [Phycisphaeraceae bacterium]|nr:hypothetical protein [Phycisphaeraceae bacterium]
MVAVLTVAAVLAAVAVPAMTSTMGMRRSAAAAQVARDLRLAREIAASDALPTWVAFDVAGNHYTLWVEQRANPGRANALPWADPATGREHMQRFGESEFAGVSLVSASIGGGTWAGFDWQGRPLSFSGAALTTTAAIGFGSGVEVLIEPGTGHVGIVP